MLDTLGYYDADNVKGFKTTRLIGFITSAIGLAGAALGFVAPDLFPFATYASALGGVGVLA